MASFLSGAAIALIAYQIQGRTNKLVDLTLIVAFVMCGFAYFIGMMVTILWECPRCGRPYNLNWFFFIPFMPNCAHCGLPFGTKEIENAA